MSLLLCVPTVSADVKGLWRFVRPTPGPQSPQVLESSELAGALAVGPFGELVAGARMLESAAAPDDSQGYAPADDFGSVNVDDKDNDVSRDDSRTSHVSSFDDSALSNVIVDTDYDEPCADANYIQCKCKYHNLVHCEAVGLKKNVVYDFQSNKQNC